jgi:Tol biopolymer transport system component
MKAWSILCWTMLTSGALRAQDIAPVRAVSIPNALSWSGSGASYSPVFSGDSRQIAFLSLAKNLVTNDNWDPYLDVFVRDLVSNTTVLVSVSVSGIGGGNGHAGSTSLSSNGQFIAFASAASNLVDNDTNGASDVFVRDLAAGITRLVSVALPGTGSAQGDPLSDNVSLSGDPVLSGDGRWVVFESYATNLADLADTNRSGDVFVRDLEMAVTKLASVNLSGAASANGHSDQPTVSSDGRWVAFASTSTDLVPDLTATLGEIYARDLQGGSLVWASQDLFSLIGAPARCFQPVLSANGTALAFKAQPEGTNLAQVYHLNLETRSLRQVHTTGVRENSVLQISADGRFVVFEDPNIAYRWDAETGLATALTLGEEDCGSTAGPVHSRSPHMVPDGSKVIFISGADNQPCPGWEVGAVVVDFQASSTQWVARVPQITLPALSPDGRFVAFENWDDGVAADDWNRASDVLLQDLESGATELVSEREAALPAVTAVARTKFDEQAINASGLWVVFSSYDNSFVPQDTNVFRDLFAADLDSGGIIPVSTQELQPTPDPTNVYPKDALLQSHAPPVLPSLTADGRFVAYVQPRSYSPLPFYTQEREIFYRDLLTGTNRSLSSLGLSHAEPNYTYNAPSVSFDGNFLCFQGRDTFYGSRTNIFYIPLLSSRLYPPVVRLYLISATVSTPETGGNGDSITPLFSPDGQWVAFLSQATDLTTNQPPPGSTQTGPGPWQLYAWNLRSSTMRLVSRGADGRALADNVSGPVFSADSRHLVFSTQLGGQLYAHSLFGPGPSELICTNCSLPSITADGSSVAYQATNGYTSLVDVFVHSRENGHIQLVSCDPGGALGGNGNSRSALMSQDGRYVAFLSRASNLVANDGNGFEDLFVRDLWHNATWLISRNQWGTGSGNGPTSRALLSGGGRTLVFESMAADLVPGDYNDRRDIFFVSLTGPDSDGDEMEDDWEQFHFGGLDRDGSEDGDGDGLSDADEYRSGTVPVDRASVFRAVELEQWTRRAYSTYTWTASVVTWVSAPGRIYRVDYRNDLWIPWRSLPGTVTAGGTRAMMIDDRFLDPWPWAPPVPRRFYRVVLLE